MLRPAGPGNTAPADLFLGLAILVTALWFASRSHVMRFPYMFPVGLSILAGALASTVAYSHAYVSVGGGLVSLIQDAFLLAWCIGIANVGRDPALLRSISRAWAISATCWAALMIVGVFGHIGALSGQDLRNGVRAAFTLGDPNLAANYFICSLLVLRATQFPRRRAIRWACCALIVTAIALTGSNGGALVLIVTTVAGAIFADGAATGRRARDHHRVRARAGRRSHRPARARAVHRRAGADQLAVPERLDRPSGGEQRLPQHDPLADRAAVPQLRQPPRHRAGRHQDGLPVSTSSPTSRWPTMTTPRR